MTENPIAENALHAAEAWLQRIDAAESSVAVVTIAPSASIGVWLPGAANVGTLAHIDDAGAELCEACAPIAERALALLEPEPQRAAVAAVVNGARLQLLLSPATGLIELRLTRDGNAVHLASVELRPQSTH